MKLEPGVYYHQWSDKIIIVKSTYPFLMFDMQGEIGKDKLILVNGHEVDTDGKEYENVIFEEGKDPVYLGEF